MNGTIGSKVIKLCDNEWSDIERYNLKHCHLNSLKGLAKEVFPRPISNSLRMDLLYTWSQCKPNNRANLFWSMQDSKCSWDLNSRLKFDQTRVWGANFNPSSYETSMGFFFWWHIYDVATLGHWTCQPLMASCLAVTCGHVVVHLRHAQWYDHMDVVL